MVWEADEDEPSEVQEAVRKAKQARLNRQTTHAISDDEEDILEIPAALGAAPAQARGEGEKGENAEV